MPGDVAENPAAYDAWVRRREHARARLRPPAGHPPLHLIMVTDRCSAAAIGRTLRGLVRQTSRRWRLTIATEEPERFAALVRQHVPRRRRGNIRVHRAPHGPTGRDLLLESIRSLDLPAVPLYEGDLWAPDAVSLLAGALTPDAVVYADEDVATIDGAYVSPCLKPDFAPDFLLSSAYVGRPMAIGAAVARRLPPLVADDGPALEHDLALAACDAARQVIHLPEVLCHRTVERRPGISTVPVREALRRRAEPATVEPTEWPDVVHVDRAHPSARVSIIVPFRDQPQFLRTCIDSVTETTRGDDVEFVLVDNGSSDLETLTLLERLVTRSDVRLLHDPRPFNWAELNNRGAELATGDVLLFLNNDIEAIGTGWLHALVSQSLRPAVGAVGARLVYPDRRLQHCGLVLGLSGAAGHPLAGLPADRPGYLHMAVAARECSAVTGACLATRREVFDLLDGFDESLGVDLNDVDFCLRAWRSGFRVVYEPRALLVHYESPSRGTAGGVDDTLRFIARWEDQIHAGDRFLNPHLTRRDASCGLATDIEEDAWNRWRTTLTAQ